MGITFKNVSFAYDNTPVLENITINFGNDKNIAIMGGSGIGKTTILHLLAGLITPQQGEITPPPLEGVAMVFQENRLLTWLTVAENLSVVNPNITYEEIEQLLGRLGLNAYAEKKPMQLSGGQARRVAIARALVFNSPLVLLDEPFTGLDSDTKLRTAEVIRTYCEHRTVVAVVHDQNDAGLLGCGIVNLHV